MRELRDAKQVSHMLMEYSQIRKGEIAELTYNAHLTIEVLLAKIKELENKTEDDRK